MHVLAIERHDGTLFNVSLRRYHDRDDHNTTPAHAAHEFEMLRLVESAGIAAPHPLLLDADGAFFGRPAMVSLTCRGGLSTRPEIRRPGATTSPRRCTRYTP